MFIRTNLIDNNFVQIDIFNLSKNKMSSIILYLNNLFNISGVLFRATGLWENISEIGSNLNNCRVDIYEGDKNKFFMKRFPEIHVDICDIKTLDTIVDSFVNINYEGRYLYFFDKNNINRLHQILIDNIYSDDNLFQYIEDNIVCLVQNMREYEDEDRTLSIIIKKEYSEKIKYFLNK